MFQRMAFIGIGLIGSSLAHVVRRDGLAGEIAVAARKQETLDAAMRLGLADTVTTDPAEAARDADIVFICTPLGAYEAVAKAIAPALKAGAIVTDFAGEPIKGGGSTDILAAATSQLHQAALSVISQSS